MNPDTSTLSTNHIAFIADVREPGEAKRAVADADFIPKPKVVKTGTNGD